MIRISLILKSGSIDRVFGVVTCLPTCDFLRGGLLRASLLLPLHVSLVCLDAVGQRFDE